MKTDYTVIGYWNTGDRRHVIGVIEGRHNVSAGVEPNDRGLFAEHVTADSAEEAETIVHGSREGSLLAEDLDVTITAAMRREFADQLKACMRARISGSNDVEIETLWDLTELARGVYDVEDADIEIQENEDD
jgi:hypothetical protein